MEHVGKMIHRQGHSTEAVTSCVQSLLTVEYPKISGEEKCILIVNITNTCIQLWINPE